MTAASPAAASASPTTSLRHLIEGRAAFTEIASFLDALSPASRVHEVTSVGGRGVKHLYDACEKAAALTVEDILPVGVEGTRIYEGKNSLPAFSRFQKRFMRLSSGQVIGYNHQPVGVLGVLIGPGYFGVKPADAASPHPTEPFFDYTVVPERSPAGWPPYKPNQAGVSKLVYANMQDYMRRVARGVLVGKAYRNGKAEDAYFTLTYAG